MLLAVSFVLSYLESLVPLPFFTFGVRLGLGNIITMFVLFFFGFKISFLFSLSKSIFVLITRGFMGGILSLFGGISSILVMFLLIHFLREKVSVFSVSILGAILHNLAQLLVVSLLYKSSGMFFLLPFMLGGGLLAGAVTATLYSVFKPYLSSVYNNFNSKHLKIYNESKGK